MIHINLLPVRRSKKQLGVLREVAAAGVVLVLLIAALVGLNVQMSAANARREQRIKELDADIGRLRLVVGEVEASEKMIQERRRMKALVDSLQQEKERPVQFLDALTQIVPEHVWLSNMEYRNAGLNLRGTAVAQEDVAELLRRMESSLLLRNVRLAQIQRQGTAAKADHVFSVSATVAFPQAPVPAPASPQPIDAQATPAAKEQL